MRKFVLLFSLLSTLHVQAQVNEFVEAHRRWMSEFYPAAEQLNEAERYKEAALVISYGLREPEAADLLRYLAPQVPELNNYLDWLDSSKGDPHFEVRTETLNALADAATKNLGLESEETVWCRLLAADNASNMGDAVPLFDQIIQIQENTVQRNPSREHRALLCMMKLARFISRTMWETFVDDPLYYDEIFETEKTALQLYPPEDDTADRTKAALYAWLAQAKAEITNPGEADLVSRKYIDTLGGTLFMQQTNGVISNAAFYFEKAIGIYRDLYTEAHPETVSLCVKQESFLRNVRPLDEESLQVAETQRIFVENYYPEKSYERLDTQLNSWICKFYLGQSDATFLQYRSMLERFRLQLGENHPGYAGVMSWVVFMTAFQYPLRVPELLDEFDAFLNRCHDDNPLLKTFLLNNVYSPLKNLMPEEAAARIEKVYALYEEHHDASALSIALGRQLVMDCYNLKADYQRAAELQELVCQDLKTRYGLDYQVYWDEELNRVDIISNSDLKTAHTLYPELVDKMRKQGANPVSAMKHHADFEYNSRQFPLAEKLYRQVLSETDPEADAGIRISLLLKLSRLVEWNGGNEQEQDRLFSEAERLLEKIVADKVLNIDVYDFVEAAGFLTDKGRYAEAIAMLDKGIEVNEVQSGAFDNQYMALITAKNEILYEKLNDRVTARRLMAQQLDVLQSNNSTGIITPAILDYLWNCYYLEKREWKDFSYLAPFFSRVMEMSITFAAQSGDQSILIKYAILVISELVELAIQFENVLAEFDAVEDPVALQFKDSLLELWSTFRDQIPLLGDLLQEMEDMIRTIDPQYESNTYYETLLNTSALFYSHVQPDPARAERYLKKAVDIASNPSSALYAELRLGNFYLTDRQLPRALEAYEAARKKLEDQPYATIQSRLEITSAFCRIYAEMQDFEALLPHARAYYEQVKTIMDGNFQLMTETEQNNFYNIFQDPAGWMTSLLEYMPGQIAGEVYDAVLYRTGMQLRSQQQTKIAIMNSGDKHLIALTDSLSRLQAEQRRLESFDFENHLIQFDTEAQSQRIEHNMQINRLEQQIIELSESYLDRHALDVTWVQVRDALDETEAAIEFVYSRNYIMALVLRKGSRSPVAVSLTEGAEFMARLQSLDVRTSARMAVKLYNDRNVDLYAMLWAPLEPYLDGVTTVYFSTPGILNNLSFAAFVTPDGGYLFDKYNLFQLSTTAKLLKPRTEEVPTSAVLMGDIYYSDRQESAAARGEMETRGTETDFAIDDFGRGIRLDHFSYLPYTKNEVANLEQTMRRRPELRDSIQIRQGKEATEHSFKELIQGNPGIIHLATHGFFVANESDAYKIPFYQRHQQSVGNSMLRTGVALAGAENSWAGAELDEENDGILTALEVSKLNLQQTKLVALSACETALGNYSFEGIFGLPRGFMQAGVESLLVSLWSVNDKSTALFMTEFYRAWLEERMTRHEAMRQAVKKVRENYPQPFYWAPFILLDAL